MEGVPRSVCAGNGRRELKFSVSVYREAQNGGQDAVFLAKRIDGSVAVGTVQCKLSIKHAQRLRPSDTTGELEHVIRKRRQFFNSVPAATQRERQSERSVFSDVDE